MNKKLIICYVFVMNLLLTGCVVYDTPNVVHVGGPIIVVEHAVVVIPTYRYYYRYGYRYGYRK